MYSQLVYLFIRGSGINHPKGSLHRTAVELLTLYRQILTLLKTFISPDRDYTSASLSSPSSRFQDEEHPEGEEKTLLRWASQTEEGD